MRELKRGRNKERKEGRQKMRREFTEEGINRKESLE
jgi:hypothetical protein